MSAIRVEITQASRTALQGYLEVLYLASDQGSKWTSADLHAAFEWALTLHKLLQISEKHAEVVALAKDISPGLPHVVLNSLQEALKSPTEVILKRLMLHTSARPEWPLKVLAAHTSACVLADPTLSHQTHQAIASLRQRNACESLLRLASSKSASPSAELALVTAAPEWLPSPASIAAEHLSYFAKDTTLELATIAALLRQQYNDATSTELKELLETVTRDNANLAAARAEIIAMSLCLPTATNRGNSSAEMAGVEANNRRRKLDRRNAPPPDPLALEFISLLQAYPKISIIIPPPLMAKSCRASFSVALQYSEALKLAQGEQVSVQTLLSCLRHACLFNDATAAFFREQLENIYRMI